MADRKWILYSQLASYLLGLIFSFCIAVPMGLHEIEFDGHCMLFSQVDLNEAKDKLFVDSWSPRAYCNYVLVTGIYIIIVCTVQIYRVLRCLSTGTDSSLLSTFLEGILCTILSAAVLAAAIIVTVGFVSWCDTIMQSFLSCGDAAGLKVDDYDNIDTTGFFIHVNIVQFGTWAEFATCVSLAVLSSLKLYHYHQDESIQEVTIFRERLLTEARLNRLPGRSTPPLLEIINNLH